MVAGVRQIVTPREDGSLEAIIPEVVVNAMMRFTAETLAAMPAYAMTNRQAKEAVATWVSLAKPLHDVRYTRWLSEEGHCWRRIPFDLVPNDGPVSLTPTWDALLERVSDKEALKAFIVWIGSLFYEGSYTQQYVWIHGQGGNGKGAITRFLHRIFGQGSHFISHIPREPNQFWTSQMLNRRIVIVPDCDNAKFPSSGLFKTLSGGDPITVERKQKDAYTAVLEAKFLYTSNSFPELSSGEADLRRAIFVNLGSKATWEQGFEERLWQEGGAFLWDCMTAYTIVCPAHGPIPIGGNELLEGWISSVEEVEEVVFDKWFEIDPLSHVVPGDMIRVLNVEWPHRRKPQTAFLEWMRRKYGVSKIRARLADGTRQNRYQGLKMKLGVVEQKSWHDTENDSRSYV